MSQYDDKSCGGKTVSQPGLKQAFLAAVMPWAQACRCSQSGELEQALGPPGEEASLCKEMPGDTGRRAHGSPCKWPARHPVCAMVVVAVLVVLVVAFAMAFAVQSAGRHGGNPDLPAAGVLACPEGWVGYRKVCFYLSREEGSWEQSQEQCSSLGASLAMLKMGWEMEFVSRLQGRDDYWIGLRRRGERLEWVDGSSFNQSFPVHSQGACAYLSNNAVASSSCSLDRPYVCSKPQAVG
ncbi:uncharacterized protein LOC142596242 [Pelecanus crispus]|uniref:uncharacterized protein LOC142596242 n=1 Tax=Pelecanus crispus TaxID=36300 RepID=UPI003F5D1188